MHHALAGSAHHARELGDRFLELGLGRYPEALERAGDVYEEDLPYLGTLTLPDLVEAAARSGELERAASAVDRLAQRAHAGGAQRAMGLLARCRALVAADEDAEPLYRDAIARLRETLVPPDVAHAHLLYGEWLRRRRRRLEARHELRIAHGLFDAIGADAFAERTRAVLLATGARARMRKNETADQLTPQEARIARLASGGLSNPEIAAQLHLSLPDRPRRDEPVAAAPAI